MKKAKLALRRETVRNLSSEMLARIAGGGSILNRTDMSCTHCSTFDDTNCNCTGYPTVGAGCYTQNAQCV